MCAEKERLIDEIAEAVNSITAIEAEQAKALICLRDSALDEALEEQMQKALVFCRQCRDQLRQHAAEHGC